MIDRWSLVLFVGFEGSVRLWRDSRIVHGAAFVASVGEGAANADGTDGVEAVGVLDALAFDGAHGRFDTGTFEGEAGDDVGNVVDGGCGHAQ